MPDIITTTYEGPDLDGYSCSIAYAELLRAQGKNAEAHIWGEPQIEVAWLLKTFNITPALGPLENFEGDVILMDASNPEALAPSISPEQVTEVIDHRKVTFEDGFLRAVCQIEQVGAAATLVAERFQKTKIEPTPTSALLLLGGIISNTQNFTGIVTDKDREMAEWLREFAKPPQDLAEQMFTAKSDLAGEKLQQVLKSDEKIMHLQGKKVGTMQLEILGVEKLLAERQGEIEEALKAFHDSGQCDFSFLNLKDLSTGVSILMCADDGTRTFLNDAPGITWSGRIGKSTTLTMRKQITAWIDEKLAK